jgi:hypothetical protein
MHTPQTKIQIIQWELNPEFGLFISYSKGLNNYYLIAEPLKATTYLVNRYIIENRKVTEGILRVQIQDIWISFSLYADTFKLSELEAYDLVLEHEETKAITGIKQYVFFEVKPSDN